MESGYAETNGQKLYYEIHGEGEPLLLIMGLGSDSTGWLLQLADFAEHFKVITFDNRDVGRSSEAAGPYTLAEMAADTAGLMDALAIERAHVLGGSMGGAIAQELVLNYPEKMNKLILSLLPWATLPALRFPSLNRLSLLKHMTERMKSFPLRL